MNNSEFIFNFFKKKGCSKVFSIVGGHALYLNAAQHKIFKKDVIYFHNEQSLSLAADSYSRILKKPSIVCVTSGPAALNCLNGILGAFIDNIPLIVISGQPRNDICASSVHKGLRQYGDQEFSRISDVVKNIVKRSIKLTLKNDLELELSKFYQTAITGRPGPVWIDVPMEVQKEKFVKKKNFFINKEINNAKDPEVTNTQIDIVIDKILKSKRPIIYAGTDINTFNCRDDFIKLIHQLKIPVVTEWNNHDLNDGSNLFVGRPGLRGDRKGNIIVYKSDLIISIGSNLSVRQVGDKPNKFSPNSFKIMINIDSVEKSKPNLEIDLFIKSRIDSFVLKLKNKTKRQFYLKSFSRWLKWCNNLKHQLKKYDIYIDRKKINPYNAINIIFKQLPKNKITVIGNGVSVVGSFQIAQIKKGDLMYQNVGCASMGYDIPGAIGACFANKKIKKKKKIFCLTGDGSFQFNFQELQLVNHHKLNLNIIVINNDGYSSMKQSQDNFIKEFGYHGVDKKSGISFPNLGKISNVYGFKYIRINNKKKLIDVLSKINFNKNHLIEVFVDEKQKFEPKVTSRVNEFGGFETNELYDMSPKIPKKLLENIMKIPKEIS